MLPRVYVDALGEYNLALQSGEPALIDETREELRFIVTRMPGLKPKLLDYLLTVMRVRWVTTLVLSLRRYLHPIARVFL